MRVCDVCACSHMCGNVCVQVSGCICGGQMLTLGVFLGYSLRYVLRQGLSLEPRAPQFGWSGQPACSRDSVTAFHGLGLHGVDVGVGDLNSDPYATVASALPAEHF